MRTGCCSDCFSASPPIHQVQPSRCVAVVISQRQANINAECTCSSRQLSLRCRGCRRRLLPSIYQNCVPPLMLAPPADIACVRLIGAPHLSVNLCRIIRGSAGILRRCPEAIGVGNLTSPRLARRQAAGGWS